MVYTTHSTCIISDGHFDRDEKELLRVVDCNSEKIHIIPDAVDQRFTPSPAVFNSEKPTILQIGTKPNKNLERLCQAISGLNVQLHIVGRLLPEQLAILHSQQIQFKNSFDLTNDQIVDAYKAADVVSLVSTHEGFGMPILEAQWTERPVVTSNISSMPEVAGEGACLADPLDVGSLRAGFRRVLDDANYREELIKAGRANRTRFSLPSVASQYISLYRKIGNQAGE